MAEKVRDWQITISSLPTPAAFNAKCIAAVPEESAAACPVPTYSANSSSKPLTFMPKGATQFVSNASFTYACS